jgi:hypothetical protein
MNELRVLLGVASAGSPTRPFLDALAQLRLPAGVAKLERSVAIGNFIPAQRELIMGEAIERDFDYLFFVDDDIVLPPDALNRLIETAEADPATAVVGGLYYSRDSVRPIVVADWHGDDTASAHIPAFTSSSAAVVDGVGFGCALLRVGAARPLAPPYFPVHIFIERSTRRVRQCDEDYRYCERMRAAGHHVRLDARVRCEHYDRASDTAAPQRWESDAETGHPRMIVARDGGAALVPLDPTAPTIVEHHLAADVVYISVD